MLVARTGKVDAAKLLLDHGARVDAKEQWEGQTALIWAAAESQPQMVKLLLEHHADPNMRSVVRDWQRKVTAEGRPKDMHRDGFTPLLYAARQACIECARILLSHGADINLPDPDGRTPLLLALMNLVTPLLAAAGAGRGMVVVNGQLLTEQQAIATVKLLKESGADINAAAKNGETALHTAALRGWNNLVRVLVACGARLDAQAVQAGLTPIDFAMGRFKPGFLEVKPTPHPDTAALLRQLGAKLEHPHLPRWPGVPTPTITAQVPE